MVESLVREDSEVDVEHPEHGRWKVRTGSFRRPPPVPDGLPPAVLPDGAEPFPGAPPAHGVEDSEDLALESLPDPPEPPEDRGLADPDPLGPRPVEGPARGP